MKKRFISAAIAVISALSIVPITLAAQQGDVIATTSISIEYHYTDDNKDTLDIPEIIHEFNRDYKLASVSEPVLEETLPIVRTYYFRVDGAMTQEELDLINEEAVFTLTPVEMDIERDVDRVEIITGLPNNDVETLPTSKAFEISSAQSSTGTKMELLERAGVSFEVTEYDAYGLPSAYTATIVYRGVETYRGVAYYNAEMSYSRSTVIGELSRYIVVAVYEPEIEVLPLPDAAASEEQLIRREVTARLEPIQGQGSQQAPAQEEEQPALIQETQQLPGFAVEDEPDTFDPSAATLYADGYPTVEEVLQELREKNVPMIRFGSMEIPLISAGNPFVWSLVCLILSVVGVLLLLATLIRFFTQKLREHKEEGTLYIDPDMKFDKKRAIAWLVTAIVMGVAGVVLFVGTENMKYLMVLLDRWTIVSAAVLIVEIIAFLLAFKRESYYSDSDEDKIVIGS